MKKLFFGAFLIMTISGYGQIEGLIQAQYETKADLAEGHPYLFEEFKNGNLKVASGSQENALIRYNLAENNIVASLNGKEYILKKDMIEAFTLESKSGENYNFIPLRIGNKQYFVQQLFNNNDNSVKFVKWYKKQFKKGAPQPGYAANENSPDRFEETLMYLFVIDGKTVEYTQKKDELLELLANGNPDVKNFLMETMKKDKLKAKDEDDVVSLLNAREEFLKN